MLVVIFGVVLTVSVSAFAQSLVSLVGFSGIGPKGQAATEV